MNEVPTRLKDALRAVGRRAAPTALLPREPAVARALARLPADMLGFSAPARGRNYKHIAEAIAEACHAGRPLDRRGLRDAPWCLWQTRPALAQDPRCLAAVLGAVAASPRRRPLRSLASAWMMSFEPGQPGMAEAARLLRDSASMMGSPWDRLSASFGLFHEAEGPRRVAEAALSGRVTPVAVLKQGGIGSLDATSGYAKACLALLLGMIEAGQVRDPMERLKRVRDVAVRPDGRLVFQELGPQTCCALLRPFREALPDRAVRDAYLDLLLMLFGDPRLRPAAWARMVEEGEMVRHWLTEQSLRQFLDVADRAAGAHDFGSMWPARRRFWEAVYDAGVVSEAWVVFSPLGVDLAKRLLGETASFGRLSRGGGKPLAEGHTVLLLRVGQRGLVADWSFNGQCNIWFDHEVTDAPRLYKANYSSDELGVRDTAAGRARQDTVSFMHSGDWQARVADEIGKITGVHIPSSSYL
ncbi:EH signature domain-containing protein [Xanthobacter oligotrophicus]|uniref:EH signature domain-containing protein n=1 Tax=Xanthobacter oligotrophicus TaxID=2607286 RepID=UPI0011F09F87|nr:EH signature domain-containing protein [Xanthobacter oligotrophicus]MCG5237823.1 EH signature domain-containing protein [Xanthobacter oligotrophicus]